MKSIVAIITAYKPDHEALNRLCDELDGTGLDVIVYDNSEESTATYRPSNPNVILLQNGENEGLGVAFNKSIISARRNFPDVEAYLFFDQDSIVERSQVVRLIERWTALASEFSIGIIGGRPVDGNGREYRVTLSGDLDEVNKISEFVISSFSLMPDEIVREIGEFDEELFIDLVDSDYCFRLRKLGYLCVIADDITFTHQVGLERMSLVGVRSFSISAPFRNYYQVRNIILVGKKCGSPLFIVSKLAKRIVQIVLSGISQGDLLDRVSFTCLGLRDGARGIGGRLK